MPTTAAIVLYCTICCVLCASVLQCKCRLFWVNDNPKYTALETTSVVCGPSKARNHYKTGKNCRFTVRQKVLLDNVPLSKDLALLYLRQYKFKFYFSGFCDLSYNCACWLLANTVHCIELQFRCSCGIESVGMRPYQVISIELFLLTICCEQLELFDYAMIQTITQ